MPFAQMFPAIPLFTGFYDHNLFDTPMEVEGGNISNTGQMYLYKLWAANGPASNI